MLKNKRLVGQAMKFLFIAVVLSVLIYESADMSFQRSSEELAISPIVAEVLDIDIEKEGFGMGRLTSLDYPDDNVLQLKEKKAEKGYKYSAYRSQVGLQGFAYAAVTHAIPNVVPKLHIYFLFRFINSFLFVVVIMAIVLQLYKRYGFLFASIFGLVTFFTPWTVDFSRNMYWVEFTWFIPMLLGLLCLNYKSKRKYIYPLFFAAILIKSLCGYEYLSTIMMSGIMFLIVEWFCNKEQRKDIFKAIFIIGILSVAGFIVAYTIHADVYGKGDILSGLESMRISLVEKRTFGNPEDHDPIFRDSLNASILDVLIIYFWSGWTERFFHGAIMLILMIATVIALIFQRIVTKRENAFEVYLFVVSLLSTVSWLVLGKAHSYIHTHMNFVLFYMGWVQTCVYIICKTILTKREIQVIVRKGNDSEIVHI